MIVAPVKQLTPHPSVSRMLLDGSKLGLRAGLGMGLGQFGTSLFHQMTPFSGLKVRNGAILLVFYGLELVLSKEFTLVSISKYLALSALHSSYFTSYVTL